MILKIIYIAGEPATGKTTLMRAVIQQLGGLSPQRFKYGRVKGTWYPKNGLFILGIYDEKTFAGTDRLSMTVVVDAVKFLEERRKTNETWLLEGDRLFNKTFLSAAKAHADLRIFVLTAEEKTKEKRHVLRGDTQSASWLQSRATKIRNLVELFPETRIRPNDDEFRMSENLREILDAVTA